MDGTRHEGRLGRRAASFYAMHRLCQRGHTYNLGQVQGIISYRVENEILQPVDHVEELLAQRSHGVGGCLCALLPTAAAWMWTGDWQKVQELLAACGKGILVGRGESRAP